MKAEGWGPSSSDLAAVSHVLTSGIQFGVCVREAVRSCSKLFELFEVARALVVEEHYPAGSRARKSLGAPCCDGGARTEGHERFERGRGAGVVQASMAKSAAVLGSSRSVT